MRLGEAKIQTFDYGFIMERNIYYKKVTKVHRIDLDFRRTDFSKEDNRSRTENVFIYTVDGERMPNTEYWFNLLFDDIDYTQLSTEKTIQWLNYAKRKHSCYRKERVNKLGRGMLRLSVYPAVQILTNYGFSENLLNDFLSFDEILKSKKTQAHEIIGIPKYVIKTIIDADKRSDEERERIQVNNRYIHYSRFSVNRDFIRNINELDKVFGGNNVKQLIKVYEENSKLGSLIGDVSNLVSLYKDYNYKDILKLAEYLTRTVKFQQGITNPMNASIYLRDYVRMSNFMEHPIEKYSKSLKKDHDIALMNYNTMKDENKEIFFKKVTQSETYQELAYKNKTFSIIPPQTVEDVVKEGETLSHCVASYVNDIIDRKCQIVFIRRSTDKNTSLLTVEIRGNSLRQVQGKSHRRPTPEETEFIMEWIENRNIEKGYGWQ